MENNNLILRTFKIDPGHSNIGFKVKHMMFAKVNGRFEKHSAQIKFTDENFENAQLEFSAQTDSINTNNKERDEHLRSADFFNAATYHTIKYHSSKITRKNNKEYIVEGYLKMNGIKNFLQLQAEFSGILKDPAGQNRLGLILTGSIDRLNWNMKWNRPLESGGILVSKEVQLIIETEFLEEQNQN